MNSNTRPRHLTVVPALAQQDHPLWPAPELRCAQHPAFEADYCLPCGTARPVGAR